MAVGKQSAAALQWVERLLEPSATEDMMIKAVSHRLVFTLSRLLLNMAYSVQGS